MLHMDKTQDVPCDLKESGRTTVSLWLSPDVVDYFKSGGEGWQTRLDEALKVYIAEHSEAA